MKLKVIDVTKNSICISEEDGEKVLNILKETLEKDEIIEVSFEGVDMLISHFLNVSIGRLYKYFDYNFIDEHLKFTNLSGDDYDLLINDVIPSAKKHHKNEDKMNQIDKELLDE